MKLWGSAMAVDFALMAPDPASDLQHLLEAGRLADLPEVTGLVGFGGGDQGHKDLWDHTKRVVCQVGKRRDLRWAALFHDVGKPSCIRRVDGRITFHCHEEMSHKLFGAASRRLRLDQDFASYVGDLIRGLGHVESYTSEWTDSAVRRVCKQLGDAFDDVVLLSRADITTKHDHKRRAHLERMSELSLRAGAIRKADALPADLPKGLGTAVSEALGVAPGPQLGKMMALLKEAVKAGELPRQGSVDDYVAFLKGLPM